MPKSWKRLQGYGDAFTGDVTGKINNVAVSAITNTVDLFTNPFSVATASLASSLQVGSNLTVDGTLYVSEDIKHSGNTTNYINFTTNTQKFYTDNELALTLDSNQDATFAGDVNWPGGGSDRADLAYGWGDHASGGYAASSHTHSYLPLSGGTVDGALTLTGGNATMTFSNSNQISHLQLNTPDGSSMKGGISIGGGASSTQAQSHWQTVRHQDNHPWTGFTDYDTAIWTSTSSSSYGSLLFGTRDTKALKLDTSQNATFYGTINSGAITSSGHGSFSSIGTSGVWVANLYDAGSSAYSRIQMGGSSKFIKFYTDGETSSDLCLTLDSSHNATFAGNVNVTGQVNMNRNVSQNWGAICYNGSSDGWGLQVVAGADDGDYTFHCKNYNDTTVLHWIKGDGSMYNLGNATFGGNITAGAAKAIAVGSLTLTSSRVKSTATNLHLDGNSTGQTYINYYGGTGGTNFADGAQGIVATIDGSGNATFTGNLTVDGTGTHSFDGMVQAKRGFQAGQALDIEGNTFGRTNSSSVAFGYRQDGSGNLMLLENSTGADMVTITNTGDATFAGNIKISSLGAENDLALKFGDGNTGFYESADNTLRIVTGGASRVYVTSTVFGGLGQNQPTFNLSNNVSATVPSFYPRSSDTNTGIGSNGQDDLSLIAGGTEVLRLEPTLATFAGNVTLSSRLTLDYGGDHYLEAGTGTWAFKNSGGTSALQLNFSDLTATFAGDVEIEDSVRLGPEQWSGHWGNHGGSGVSDCEFAAYGRTFFDIAHNTFTGAKGFDIYNSNEGEFMLRIDPNYLTFQIDPEGICDPVEFGGGITIDGNMSGATNMATITSDIDNSPTIYVDDDAPSGGSSGDIWLEY